MSRSTFEEYYGKFVENGKLWHRWKIRLKDGRELVGAPTAQSIVNLEAPIFFLLTDQGQISVLFSNLQEACPAQLPAADEPDAGSPRLNALEEIRKIAVQVDASVTAASDALFAAAGRLLEEEARRTQDRESWDVRLGRLLEELPGPPVEGLPPFPTAALGRQVREGTEIGRRFVGELLAFIHAHAQATIHVETIEVMTEDLRRGDRILLNGRTRSSVEKVERESDGSTCKVSFAGGSYIHHPCSMIVRIVRRTGP